MAKQIHSIHLPTFNSNSPFPSETLNLTGQTAEYVVSDTGDSALRKNGRIALDDINGSDTVDTMWASIVAAIKAAEGIS